MEIKKNPKADLEGRKLTFVLIGLTAILATLFVAFEWTTSTVVKYDNAGVSEGLFEEEIIPPTVQEATPPPPPPPAPVVEEIINIVEDDAQVEQVEIQSSEDDQNVAQEIVQIAAPVEEEEEVTNEIFTVVEDMPAFPGGESALLGFISKSVKYPVIAQENGIQGRVIVSFVIERDGSVADAVVVRGVDPSLDKEALRVVKSMPKWTPGKQRGKPVRVKYTLPVTFRLQ